METWDALRARRNVRSYADRPIAPDDLERILEAARRSPSSMNQQAWDFVVVTDRVRRGRIAGRSTGSSIASAGRNPLGPADRHRPRS